MEPTSFFGKFLIIAGIIVVIFGVLIYLSPKLPYLGKLPGDIRIERENFRFYFPLTTSIILSLLLTLLLNLLFRR